MNVGSLFSGIGGIELGLERAGFRTIWFSETEPFAAAVLKKNWADVPNLGDITQIDWRTVERPDVLAGGFPCQDISIAGTHQGIKEGTRSGLWFKYVEAIRVLRPRYVIVENVAALLVRGMDIVLRDLSKIGYDAEWRVLQASDFGAPHKRERLFLVAYPSEERRNDGILNHLEYAVPAYKEWDLAKDLKTGREWKCWLTTVCQADNGQISKADFCGVDDGIPEGLDRIGSLGNAVVPQIAEAIGRAIKRQER